MSDNKALPLKLKDSDGNLQQITSAETNFVAYLASLQTAQADSSDVGLLTLSSSGNRLVGSFVDTYYPEPSGTHPFNLASIVTTTTNLYQINGTASEADSDWRKPVGHFGGNVYEMSDTDFNNYVDTVNGRIALSDYPGTLQLASTRPSAEYEILIPSVFTDQRTDSSGSVFTVNDYHIWRKVSMTAPTSIRDDLNGVSSLVGVKRSNGDSGDYLGLEKLTNRQIQVTVGQRAKTRRSIDGNIGSYDLRTSSEGAPVSGTWKSVGSATNTLRDVADVNYTRTRSSAYTRSRSSTYADDYTRSRSSTFAGNYAGNYSRTFAGNYARDFTGNYLRPFVGNYSRTFAGEYTRTRITDFVGDYVGNYSRTFAGNYSRNFAGNYSRNFAGNFVGNYTRISTRVRTSVFSRTRVSTYVGNYIGDFIGDYARTVSVDYSADYTRTVSVDYSADYTRTRVTNYTANFSRQTISTYISYYTRQTLAGNFTRTRVSSYQRTGGYLGDYGRTFYFAGNFTGDYARVLTFIRELAPGEPEFFGRIEYYTRVSTRTSTAFMSYARTSTRILDYTRSFIGDYIFPGYTAVYTRTAIYVDNVNFVGDYVGNFVGNYVGNNVVDFVGNYVGNNVVDFVGEYSRNAQVDYTRTAIGSFVGNYAFNFTGDFTGNYTRTSTRTRTSAYSRTRSSTYITNRVSTYSQNYSATYTGNFLGNYVRNRSSAYARTRNEDYTRTRNSAFTRNRSSTYIGTYTRNRVSTFAGNYVGNYSRSFAGNYSRNFVGNYAGLTIQSGTNTIETYTLYVRTA